MNIKTLFISAFLVFLFHGFSINCTKAQELNNSLINAVKNNRLENIKQLINKGANINAQDENKASVIMWAVYKGDIETVKYLVKKKVNYKKKGVIYINKEKTAYYGNLIGIAAGENKADILRFLLEKCKIDTEDKEYDPITKKETGWTALQWAANNGNNEIIKLLLEKGANINANHTESKETPLMNALNAQKYSSAQILIENGADVNLHNSNKWTALHYISMDEKPEILRLLLKNNASPNVENNNGFTPLIISAYNNRSENCKLLVEYGASIFRCDKSNKNAIDYASIRGFEKIRKYLYNTAVQDNKLNEKIKTGINYYNNSQYKDALEQYEKIISEIEVNYSKYDTTIYINVLLHMAHSSQSINKYEKAKTYYKSAESVYKTISDTLNKEYGRILINAADVYNKAHDYKNAESYYSRTVVINKHVYGDEHNEYGASILVLAYFYNNTGNYNKAEQLYLQAIEIFKKTNDEDLYDACLSNLSILYMNTENYNKAELLGIETLKARKIKYGENSVKYAVALSNLATLYSHLGDYTKALEYYSGAIHILLEKKGADKDKYLTCLQNTAEIYSKIGDYKRAEKYFKLVIKKEKEIFGENNTSYASSLHNLSALYCRLNKPDTALSLSVKSNTIFKNIYGNMHPEYATSLNSLAFIYKMIGDSAGTIQKSKEAYKKAEQLFMESFEINNKVLPENSKGKATNLHNLAMLYNEKGNLNKFFLSRNNRYKKAEDFFIQANHIHNFAIEKSGKYMSEKEREIYLNNIIKYYFMIYHSFFLAKRKRNPEIPGIIYNNALVHKGLLLKSTLAFKNAVLNSKDDDLIKKYDEYILRGKQLELLYSQVPEERVFDLDSIEITQNNIEKELIRQTSGLSGFGDFTNPKWRNIQKSLDRDEVAVEFINFRYYDGRKWTDSIFYYALILRKDYKFPKAEFLFEEKQLLKLLEKTSGVSEYEYIKEVYGKKSEKSESLYTMVFKPIEKHLSNIKTIYLSLSGILNRISFDAVPVIKNSKDQDNDLSLLSDKYKIFYNSSSSQVINKTGLFKKDIKNAVLFGGIEYNIVQEEMNELSSKDKTSISHMSVIRSIDSLNRSVKWSYLPGTLTETENIKSTLIDKNIKTSFYTGINASENIFKALSNKSSDIIHISTHGFYFPNRSISILRNTPINENILFTSSENSLLRSGLLFAGGQNAFNGEKIPIDTEDGVLTAYEVSHLNLYNTKLAVLSACQTGLGDVKGSEGVYGLQRAFKMAGVEYLLISLWEVPDEQTRELMSQFYKNWLSGMEIRVAFKKAQDHLKDKYKDIPGSAFAWAAFVLMK